MNLPDIKTLPQWAQVYIRRLLLQVETLRTQHERAKLDLYEAERRSSRQDKLEELVALLKELINPDTHDPDQ